MVKRATVFQNRPAGTSGITFFVALSPEVGPSLYQFQLDAYEELLELDIHSIASGDSDHQEFIRTDPLTWSAPTASGIVAVPE